MFNPKSAIEKLKSLNADGFCSLVDSDELKKILEAGIDCSLSDRLDKLEHYVSELEERVATDRIDRVVTSDDFPECKPKAYSECPRCGTKLVVCEIGIYCPNERCSVLDDIKPQMISIRRDVAEKWMEEYEDAEDYPHFTPSDMDRIIMEELKSALSKKV